MKKIVFLIFTIFSTEFYAGDNVKLVLDYEDNLFQIFIVNNFSEPLKINSRFAI